ncbi:MAG: hypothetical protein V2B15_19080 [Bacteroidota bacterium]
MKTTIQILRITATFGMLGFFALHNLQAQQQQQGFNYQAVARNLSGAPMTDLDLTVKIAIHVDSGDGELIWEEEHAVRTSSLGLFTLEVGGPDALKGAGSASSFDQIDWSAHSYFLSVWVKTDGEFMNMGGSPIQTVPLARYAASAKSATTSFSVQPSAEPQPGEALFEVKRKDGQPVFAVYEDMVWVYVDTLNSKGRKGGFAVGGYSRTKGVTEQYMHVNSDSVRIYIDTDPSAKGRKGGFAVGGYSRSKAAQNDLFFNLLPGEDEETTSDKSQILFYPTKDAFFAGTIHIGSPDSIGFNSTSLGYKSVAMGQYSQGFGYKSMALGDYSTAIGREAVALENSFALGNTSKALGNDSYAFGSGARASGDKSFAFGSVGIDTLGIPTGVSTSATGDYSIAFGMGAQALNSGAMSLGASSTANGFQSVAIGSGTTAGGSYASAIGYRSQANGYKSIAIGAHYSYVIFSKPTWPPSKPRTITRNNSADGDYSISFGNGNYSNDGGFALGTYNNAYAQGAVSLGVSNSAYRSYAFAAGYNNDAVGYYSVAIGENLYSQAMNSLAIGTYNEILGDTASWVETDPLFQIGNGTGTSDRNDAFRINKNGSSIMDIKNSTNGVKIMTTIEPDFTGTYSWGLLNEIERAKDGISYYSGVFRDAGTLGTYYGLFADIRAGDGFDVAEYYYDPSNETGAGDVVVADPANNESVTKSAEPYQTSVLGVVSTKPHLVMGMDLVMDEETGEPIEGVSVARLALSGRVPVKVTEENGAIGPGDLLTTSSTPGYAMKWTLLDVNEARDFDELKRILAENERRRNAIIGKAVGFSSGDEGTVMVLISLQ